MEAKNDLIQNVRSKKLKTISEKVDNNELPLDLRSPSAESRNDELLADLSDLLKVAENVRKFELYMYNNKFVPLKDRFRGKNQRFRESARADQWKHGIGTRFAPARCQNAA